MTSYRLPRASRLKKRQLIRPLFDRSREDVWSVVHGCIRLICRGVSRRESGADVPLQVGFSPGRGRRRAVDRNRVKRQMREVFRLNQSVLSVHFEQSEHTMTMMVLFRGRIDRDLSCIRRDLPIALEKASKRCRSQS